MNNDLISREALKKAIKDNGYSHYFKILEIIDNAPTVECTWIISGKRYGKKEEALKYLRPHGKWLEHKYNDWISDFHCSRCGLTYQNYESVKNLNFCPNCGADMRGGNTNE